MPNRRLILGLLLLWPTLLWAANGDAPATWNQLSPQEQQILLGQPPGRYRIEARHRKAGSLGQEVVFSRDEEIELSFDFKVPEADSP